MWQRLFLEVPLAHPDSGPQKLYQPRSKGGSVYSAFCRVHDLFWGRVGSGRYDAVVVSAGDQSRETTLKVAVVKSWALFHAERWHRDWWRHARLVEIGYQDARIHIISHHLWHQLSSCSSAWRSLCKSYWHVWRACDAKICDYCWVG